MDGKAGQQSAWVLPFNPGVVQSDGGDQQAFMILPCPVCPLWSRWCETCRREHHTLRTCRPGCVCHWPGDNRRHFYTEATPTVAEAILHTQPNLDAEVAQVQLAEDLVHYFQTLSVWDHGVVLSRDVKVLFGDDTVASGTNWNWTRNFHEFGSSFSRRTKELLNFQGMFHQFKLVVVIFLLSPGEHGLQ